MTRDFTVNDVAILVKKQEYKLGTRTGTCV